VSDSPNWRIPPLSELRWRFWDGQAVVFDASSANTHFLDAFSAELLLLLNRPSNIGDLTRNLAARLTEEESVVEARVVSALKALADAGLVELTES
jgi:PqqD family protein of HPr-rel-A system